MKHPALARLATCFAMLSFAAAAVCYFSYGSDAAVLRGKASEITAGIDDPAQRVLTLLHWVHNETGTATNEQSFYVPQLGATPRQVLESGGDCADKSRLLSAMLRQIGVPATMAMCINPDTEEPSHTVVEAQIGPGHYMVVDPAFDLAFPKPDSNGYYGLVDLRHDPSILDRRLDQLAGTLPPGHPQQSYNRAAAVYDEATTLNWNKNVVTAFIRDQLVARLGDGVYRLPRPLLLEEPQLAIASVMVLLGFIFGFAAVLSGKQERAQRRRPMRRPATTSIVAKARESLGYTHQDA